MKDARKEILWLPHILQPFPSVLLAMAPHRGSSSGTDGLFPGEDVGPQGSTEATGGDPAGPVPLDQVGTLWAIESLWRLMYLVRQIQAEIRAAAAENPTNKRKRDAFTAVLTLLRDLGVLPQVMQLHGGKA
jgi:hypothetical protein